MLKLVIGYVLVNFYSRGHLTIINMVPLTTYHQPMVQETNLDMLKCILGSEDLGDKCINQNVLFMDELKIISLVLFPQASQPSINQKKV